MNGWRSCAAMPGRSLCEWRPVGVKLQVNGQLELLRQSHGDVRETQLAVWRGLTHVTSSGAVTYGRGREVHPPRNDGCILFSPTRVIRSVSYVRLFRTHQHSSQPFHLTAFVIRSWPQHSKPKCLLLLDV